MADNSRYDARRGNDPCHHREEQTNRRRVRRLRLKGVSRRNQKWKWKRAYRRLRKLRRKKKRRKRRTVKMAKSAERAGPNLLNRKSRRRVGRSHPGAPGRSHHRRNAQDPDPRTEKSAIDARDPGKSGESEVPNAADLVLVSVRDAGPHRKEGVVNHRPTAAGVAPGGRRLEEETGPRTGKGSQEVLRQQDRQSQRQRNAICAPCYVCSCHRK